MARRFSSFYLACHLVSRPIAPSSRLDVAPTYRALHTKLTRVSSTVIPIRSSVPLQILLYYNALYSAVFVLAQILLFIYKGTMKSYLQTAPRFTQIGIYRRLQFAVCEFDPGMGINVRRGVHCHGSCAPFRRCVAKMLAAQTASEFATVV